VWINPRLLGLPVPLDNITVFLQKLRCLTKVAMQTVNREGCITLEPPIPYTEFYMGPIKRYDHVFVHYWSIVAKTIVRRVENTLRILKPKLCLSTHVFGGLLGSVLKERNLVEHHIYYDLDNFSTIPPFDVGLSTQISQLENKIVQNADLVWSVSRTLGNLRKTAGARKVLIVPNAVDRDLFARAVKLRESRSTGSLEKPLSIVYAGTIHPNWGVDVLLQAFDILIKKGYNIRLVLVGPATPPLLETIRALQSSHFDKLQYFGVVPRSKFSEVLSLGDIGVAPYKLDSHAGYGDSLKIKEYVAAGLPVISSPIDEIRHFLQENNVGVTCEPSVNGLAEALITLIEKPQLREELTKNALQLKLSSWEENFDVAFEETFEALESVTNIKTKEGSPKNG
jgi:glycosyltransferase involved in cell wall biosynthesis